MLGERFDQRSTAAQMITDFIDQFEVDLSRHARERSALRGISLDGIRYVLTWATELRRTGVQFHFLRRCDIPMDHRRIDSFANLAGTVIIEDGTMITVYRDPEAFPKLRRKTKYRRTPRRRE
jgi:hypothetical protein